MKHAAIISILIAIFAVTLSAQDPVSFVPFEALAGGVKDVGSRPGTVDDKKREIAGFVGNHTQEFALYALGASVYSSLVEEGRLDKQVGTSSAAAGSTSLVSRGSVPSILGVAVESGALYQSVSGSVVTFRLNPAGLARALAKNSYLLSREPVDAAALDRGLSRLSASASFDYAQGSSPGTFTGERSQLKEATLRVDIVNKRDPRHPAHAASIQRLGQDMGSLMEPLAAYFKVLEKMPEYSAWREATAAALVDVNAQNDAALRAALFKAGDEFASAFASNGELQTLGKAIVDGFRSYRALRDKAFESIAKSSILTFEYAFNRLSLPEAALAALPADTILPDLSTARLIFSSPVGSVGEATVNGSVTIFNSTLPEMRGNLRDIQVSGSLDFRLPNIQSIGKPVLTFAGLTAFLHQQPFGVKVKLRDVETEDGVIGVFQTKLTIPAGPNGVHIPVSFTVANRSEFNTEKELRGSIGLTFDLDKLFSR